MRPRNPFYEKTYEGTESEQSFLTFFNAEALKFIDDRFLESVHFINSSPGAGKTSIFKAFSPNILQRLMNNKTDEKYKDLYSYMCERQIFRDGEIKLLCCYISCARNYDIIEDIYINGKRKQVLFALLNTRIVIAGLRTICAIKGLDEYRDLGRITFSQIPDEMYQQKDVFTNGESLYDWACETESSLCRYLDDYEDTPLQISFIHTTLLCLKLFEPSSVMVDGIKFVDRTLFIFDDYHKMTEMQKESIEESVFILRPRMGIWFGQRLIGLSKQTILSPDGMVGREYPGNSMINLEGYWSQKSLSQSYLKMVCNIADRRLYGIPNISQQFEDLVEQHLNFQLYQNNIEQGIVVIREKIIKEFPRSRYQNIFDTLENMRINYETAIHWQVLWIMMMQKTFGQMELDFVQKTQEEFDEFYESNKNVAEYYFKTDNNIPYYYGMNVLKRISSFNIEQFLSFAGAVFATSSADRIIGGKNAGRISAELQQKLYMELAEQRWNNISVRYDNAEKIQNLLDNLCKSALKIRNREANSYEGGSPTGFGIEKTNMKIILEEDKYRELRDVLRDCISGWYLEKREILQGGKEWLVFYYNRWICVKYQLPLNYGGWKSVKMGTLCNFLHADMEKKDDFDYVVELFEG